jgi:hypothetical protein
MRKVRFILNLLAVVVFALAVNSTARAQASRTWVSGVGDDVNPCSRTAPCKTFAGAISKTAAGGEIDALDPGGFGAVTITKALTIDGGGGQVASVLVSNTNGIVVQAGVGDVVTLNNLRIQGVSQTASPGQNAIRFTQGKALNVLNCYIYNFSQNGIDVALNQSQNATVFVKDTVVKNCAGDGIALNNLNTGTLKFAIERSSFVENGNGAHVLNALGTARNSVFSLNSTDGVFSDAAAGGSVAVIRVWESQISSNGTNGVQAGKGGNAGTSVVEISGNQIDQNTGGSGALVSTGGTVNTFSNNSIAGNGTNGCVGCTPSGPGN